MDENGFGAKEFVKYSDQLTLQLDLQNILNPRFNLFVTFRISIAGYSKKGFPNDLLFCLVRVGQIKIQDTKK